MPAPRTRAERAALRTALAAAYPWLCDTGDDAVGPQTVDAGECDRCGTEARVVQVCGPGAQEALGRRCALELGTEAWCEGHRTSARAAIARLRDLPKEVDLVSRAWWVATGEVRLTSADAATFDEAVRRLPPTTP